MNVLKQVIEVNPEILGGKPVFKGTRVSVSTLFDCFETTSLDDFLEGHPAITREHAMAVLQFRASSPEGDVATGLKLFSV